MTIDMYPPLEGEEKPPLEGGTSGDTTAEESALEIDLGERSSIIESPAPLTPVSAPVEPKSNKKGAKRKAENSPATPSAPKKQAKLGTYDFKYFKSIFGQKISTKNLIHIYDHWNFQYYITLGKWVGSFILYGSIFRALQRFFMTFGYNPIMCPLPNPS